MKVFICLLSFIFSGLFSFSQISINSSLKKIEKKYVKTGDKLYASIFEVTNLQYREFLYSLKVTGSTADFALAQIDSMGWKTKKGYMDPYIEFYHCHPAYNEYPVVNISWEAANLYCKWLTEIYNSYDKRKFKKVIFRLPTKEEWMHAACGGLSDQISDGYPWGSYYLTNYKGDKMCNYKIIGDQNIHWDTITHDMVIQDDLWGEGYDIIAPANSYYPNGFGLYCVSGNVGEMISQKGIAKGGSWESPGGDVKINSEEFYSKPCNHIGFRVFMEVIEE